MQKRVFTVRETGQVKAKNRLVRLVGEKPMLQCKLNGVECSALWDTGSMVSIVSSSWFRNLFPDAKVLKVAEFLEGDNLHLCAANNTPLEVQGVAILEFRIGDSTPIPVPFLITEDDVAQPIIGFNVIEFVVLAGGGDMTKYLRSSLQVFPQPTVEAVVNVLQTGVDPVSDAKTTARTVIPPHTRCRVKCKTGLSCSSAEESVVFSPDLLDSELEFQESVASLRLGRTPYVNVVVSNPTNVEKVIPKGVVLGTVEPVSAVMPIFPKDDIKLSGGARGGSSGFVNEVDAEVRSDNSGVPLGDVSHRHAEASTDPDVPDGWIPDVDLSHLSEERKKIVEDMLKDVSAAFQRDKSDHGNLPDLQMEIPLCDGVPVCVPHRHVPRPLYDEVKNFVNDLIVNNWVRESKSPYSSPIVCVRKKDQSLRLCIDYRALNRKVIPDRQPIPRIQEIFDGLGGQEWFSTLDMAKAYHQGYVKEEFRKFTAFSTPWGHYEWIRIPMGISNAPPAFQRYINMILVGLRDTVCVAYLDDILVYGRSFEHAVHNLKLVLVRLISRGVKLRADKCKILMEEVRYLGRLVSKNGCRPDPEDTKALEKFRIPPKTVGDLRSMLGFFGYYRNYVKDFAKSFKPLYDLLKNRGKVPSTGKKSKSSRLDSRSNIEWNSELQKVVDKTIDYLQSPEFLVFPDFNEPFVLHCDASEKGLGAVLYQKRDGKARVISYASRTLTDAEKNYHLHSGKLEFLALKWAVTERFSDYLCYGPPFTVFTDNNPLTYVMSSAKLNATGLRWVADLSNYQFTIRYRPGKLNGDADGLSRVCDPADVLDGLEKSCSEVMDPKKISVTSVSVQPSSAALRPSSLHVDVNLLELKEAPDTNKVIGKDELREAQLGDDVIGPVYSSVLSGTKPRRSKLSHKTKVLLKQFPKLVVEDGLLKRKLKDRTQLVLPYCFHDLVFSELHQKMGHLGSDRVEELCRQRFHWPHMKADVEDFIRNRCPCLASKAPNRLEQAPLVPIIATYPFEIVSMDYLKLDKCKGGYNHVLVVTDHFTRFAQAYPTKNKNSKSAAAKIFNEYIPQFGFPKRMLTDCGGEFTSDMFKELHRLSGIDPSTTTPYHPMGNGKAERFNRTLCNMLKAIPETEKKRWSNHVSKLCFAYNSTTNSATGFTPFYLMFGRESRLPIDCLLPIEGVQSGNKTHAEFVREWKKSMKEAFQLASRHAEKTAAYNKKKYDARIKQVDLDVGDRVLLKNLEKGGTGKLRSFWEQKIYVVAEKDESLPVYKVKQVGGSKTKTVHRNLLMRVNDLPLNSFGQVKTRKKTKKKIPVVKNQTSVPVRKPADPAVPDLRVDSSSDSDSGLDAVVLDYPRLPPPPSDGGEGPEDLSEPVVEVDEVPDPLVGQSELSDVGHDGSTAEDSTAADDEDSDSDDAGQADSQGDTTVQDEGEATGVYEEGQMANGSTASDEVDESVPEARDTSATSDASSSSNSSDYSPGENETLSGSDTSKPQTPTTPLTVRRSNRQGRARRIFGYDSLGGKPKMTRYNALMNINTSTNKTHTNK